MRTFGLIILIILAAMESSQSQPGDIRFKRITPEQGLSQSTIKCIFKDSHGYMWFGTRDGLNKYDGYTFTVYRHEPPIKTSLTSSFIIDILEDSHGNLWVGTTQGLNLFNRQTNSFQHFPIENKSPYIADLLEDSKGNLWVGTNIGLYIFDLANKTWRWYKHDVANPASIIDSGVNKVAEDKDGNIWVATPLGLDHLDIRTQVFTHYFDNAKREQWLSSFITNVYKDKKGRIWAGLLGGGLALWDENTKAFLSFIHNPANPNSLCHNEVLSLAEDMDGRLWIGTQNGGISLFDYQSQTFVTYQKDINDPTSLSNNSVHAIYKDDQNNMWVGTWAGGISFYSRYVDKFASYRKVLNSNNLNITAITGDQQGNIWLALEDTGLILYDRKKKSFHKYENDNSHHILTTVPVSIVDLNKDSLAVGYHLGGFAFFNKITGKFTHNLPQIGNPTSIQGVVKPALLQDSDHNFWIGDWGAGLSFYNKRTKQFTNYFPDPKNPRSLSNNVVFSLYEDREKNIWIGTEGGLNRFDRQNNQFVRYQHDDQNKYSLSHNTVNTIFEDHRGNLWIGTAGGLSLFDKKAGIFTSYTQKDGLPNNLIYSIQEDANDNLWLSTTKGLCKFDVQHKTFRNYDVKDGLQGNEFNRNASYKASDGTMYFAGTTGFTVFHPDSIDLLDNPYIPPVVITDFQIFNESLSPGKKGSPLQKSISETSEVTLSYQQSVFSIEYAALNFINVSKNQYAYQLEGFDEDWNYVDTKRLATYTNLDPGEYTFRVKASNNDGVWNKEGATIKLTITPPFWQTWWFRTIALVTIVGSVITLFRIRLNAVGVQKAELERQVKERTIEVVAQKEALQDQADTLQMFIEDIKEKQKEAETARQEAEEANRAKGTFLATMSHEIRTPMNGVIGMASLLAETNQTNEQKEYTETIRSCGENLLNVINDILDFSKIESGKMELEAHDFDLRTCIEEVLDVFANKASQIGLDLVYQIDYNVPTKIIGDGMRLRQVMLNLVSNAIKFTQQGEIFLGVRLRKMTENQGIELGFEVRDSGIGIPANKIDRLFKSFSQVDSSTTRKYGGTGLGLVICEKLIGLMGGSIEVSSRPGQGTTFSFSIQVQASTDAVRTYVNCNMVGLEGKRILVVDDNATNRLILQSQLEQWQLVPVMAESGVQALSLLATQPDFDLVITDMQMPEMDGVELSQVIRARCPSLAIMVLSSMGQERSQYPADLFCAVLTKPVKQQILSKHILNQLKQSDKAVVALEERKLNDVFARQYPLRILIAEDNLVNQKLAIRVLNKLGYQPELASDGQQAVSAVLGKKYDLVLMDVQMPEMDGLEATRVIRQQSVDSLVIVAMTANAMQGDREECLQAGMDDYLSKPIKLEELVKILEKWAIQLTINN